LKQLTELPTTDYVVIPYTIVGGHFWGLMVPRSIIYWKGVDCLSYMYSRKKSEQS